MADLCEGGGDFDFDMCPKCRKNLPVEGRFRLDSNMLFGDVKEKLPPLWACSGLPNLVSLVRRRQEGPRGSAVDFTADAVVSSQDGDTRK